MKSTHSLFTALFFLCVIPAILLTSGCKKNNPGDFGGTGEMTIVLDGVSYSFSLQGCLYDDGTINLGLITEDDGFLQFHTDVTGKHTFNSLSSGGQGLQDVFSFTVPAGTTYSGTEGELNVETLTKNKTKGTLNMTVLDDPFNPSQTMNVTGTFEADF